MPKYCQVLPRLCSPTYFCRLMFPPDVCHPCPLSLLPPLSLSLCSCPLLPTCVAIAQMGHKPFFIIDWKLIKDVQTQILKRFKISETKERHWCWTSWSGLPSPSDVGLWLIWQIWLELIVTMVIKSEGLRCRCDRRSKWYSHRFQEKNSSDSRLDFEIEWFRRFELLWWRNGKGWNKP